MKNEWKRGHGQRYKHLVVREEKTVNGTVLALFCMWTKYRLGA